MSTNPEITWLQVLQLKAEAQARIAKCLSEELRAFTEATGIVPADITLGTVAHCGPGGKRDCLMVTGVHLELGRI